jgi:hypothetical protein
MTILSLEPLNSDVRPEREEFADSKYSSHGLHLHTRETGFVRIAE